MSERVPGTEQGGGPRTGGFAVPRPRPRPGRGAIAASIVAHVLIVGGAIAASLLSADPLPAFEVYRVELVSPPPAEAGPDLPAPPEPEMVAPPEPREPEPQLEPEPLPPEPEPEKRPRDEPPPKQERSEPEPSRGPEPDPESPGGENLEVQIDGKEFSDPAYLENITRQNRRYFRWGGDPGLRACVYFEILRDGGTRAIEVIRPSGNFRFDLAARGAVEAAGSRKAYGPLPASWPHEYLPVAFYFTPNGIGAC